MGAGFGMNFDALTFLLFALTRDMRTRLCPYA